MTLIRPVSLAGFLCIGLALAPAKQGLAQAVPASPIGHSYELKFSDARWWTMDVQPTKLLFTAMSGEKKGQVVLTVDNPTLREIGSGVYLVYWQERDKSTAVHVYDFARGHAYFNTTKPDGTFLNLEGPVTLVK
jgi:hypothetical protein